jgi:hypothetical protein
MLIVGLIAGVVIGGAAAYFIFHGKTATTTGPASTPSASVAPTATATATPTATATAAAAQGVMPCPVATPSGQHPLGNPAPPSGGRRAVASLDFCGRGDATIPPGTTRFMTGNNWELGIADSCPQGSSGQGGMNTVLTVNELLTDGSQGPDTATEPGDWVDSGGQLMPGGGNYQLQVSTVSPDCVWHIAIYPA